MTLEQIVILLIKKHVVDDPDVYQKGNTIEETFEDCKQKLHRYKCEYKVNFVGVKNSENEAYFEKNRKIG